PFFFLFLRPPPLFTLFPYTTLFRSLSPALTALLLRPRKKGAGPLGKFFEWFNRWFGKMTGGYVTWSHVLIRRWVLALLLLVGIRSEEHTSELQSLAYLVCRLLLEQK